MLIDQAWGDLRGAPEDLRVAVAAGEARDFILQREMPALFVRVNARPVHDPEGRATGAVLLLRDVTQETLDRNVQQDVLSLVSHKFRTPLTVVHSWTSVLLEDGCGKLEDSQREALEAVSIATNQLRGLLDGILAYVEWTQRLQRIRKQRTEFIDLARTLRQRIQIEMGAEAAITVEHDDGYVDTDAGLLVDALFELVENARKFGDAATRVRVTLRCPASNGGGDGHCAIIQVIDDGPGIPPEHHERIFQRFYQVEAEFTGQVHGLGLGLSRVQRAARALGAKIDVESELKRGSCFSLRF